MLSFLQKLVAATFGAIATFWLHLPPAGHFLAFLMLLDVVGGTARAVSERRVSLAAGYFGAWKKVGALLTIVLFHLLETYIVHGIPLTEFACYTYITYELLSFTRNMAALGVPMPPWMKQIAELLEKRANPSELVFAGEVLERPELPPAKSTKRSVTRNG